MSKIYSFVDDGYGGEIMVFSNLGNALIVVVAILLVLLGCFIFGKNKKFPARQIAFSGVGVALAVVTSMLKLFKMPMGGSVTLFSMFFIVLIAYWFGLGTGLTTALAYGVLQLLLDPWIISIPQMLLDYVFAFGALGLAGFFAKSKYGLVKGYLLGVCARFVVSTISGVIFFATYMPEFFNNPWFYSICYNGAYIAAEAALTLVVYFIPPVKKGVAYITDLARQ